jgi:hypothetical protein
VAPDLLAVVDADGGGERAAGTGRINRVNSTSSRRKAWNTLDAGVPFSSLVSCAHAGPELATASPAKTTAPATSVHVGRTPVVRFGKAMIAIPS